MKRLAIIGGTGMKELFEKAHYKDFGYQLLQQENKRIKTSYGNVPVTIIVLEKEGESFFLQFVHRHHGIGTTPPHAINNHANVTAAASCDPLAVMSIQSVGSMSTEFAPGTLGMVEDFIDFTGRVSTFHSDTAVHVDLSDHFRKEYRDILRPILEEAQKDKSRELCLEHVVSQMTGPQFETPAEIRALMRLGATTVGMTLAPEAKLIAEKSLGQIGLIVSSNWASGCDPKGPDAEIDHHLVEARAAQLHKLIWKCIVVMAESL